LLNFKNQYEGDFDAHFGTPGITTIGVSVSKYGLGFTGTAVLLYRTRKLRKCQYYCFSTWNGGMYATPNLAGSRYSTAISASWAKMLTVGEKGYADRAEKIMIATTKLREALLILKNHIQVLTPTSLSILAFRLRRRDTYDMADFLRSKGWDVTNVVNPSAISYAITDGKLK
jgi:sphinganine-1-phosphate aldolase